MAFDEIEDEPGLLSRDRAIFHRRGLAGGLSRFLPLSLAPSTFYGSLFGRQKVQQKTGLTGNEIVGRSRREERWKWQ